MSLHDQPNVNANNAPVAKRARIGNVTQNDQITLDAHQVETKRLQRESVIAVLEQLKQDTQSSIEFFEGILQQRRIRSTKQNLVPMQVATPGLKVSSLVENPEEDDLLGILFEEMGDVVLKINDLKIQLGKINIEIAKVRGGFGGGKRNQKGGYLFNEGNLQNLLNMVTSVTASEVKVMDSVVQKAVDKSTPIIDEVFRTVTVSAPETPRPSTPPLVKIPRPISARPSRVYQQRPVSARPSIPQIRPVAKSAPIASKPKTRTQTTTTSVNSGYWIGRRPDGSYVTHGTPPVCERNPITKKVTCHVMDYGGGGFFADMTRIATNTIKDKVKANADKLKQILVAKGAEEVQRYGQLSLLGKLTYVETSFFKLLSYCIRRVVGVIVPDRYQQFLTPKFLCFLSAFASLAGITLPAFLTGGVASMEAMLKLSLMAAGCHFMGIILAINITILIFFYIRKMVMQRGDIVKKVLKNIFNPLAIGKMVYNGVTADGFKDAFKDGLRDFLLGEKDPALNQVASLLNDGEDNQELDVNDELSDKMNNLASTMESTQDKIEEETDAAKTVVESTLGIVSNPDIFMAKMSEGLSDVNGLAQNAMQGLPQGNAVASLAANMVDDNLMKIVTDLNPNFLSWLICALPSDKLSAKEMPLKLGKNIAITPEQLSNIKIVLGTVLQNTLTKVVQNRVNILFSRISNVKTGGGGSFELIHLYMMSKQDLSNYYLYISKNKAYHDWTKMDILQNVIWFHAKKLNTKAKYQR